MAMTQRIKRPVPSAFPIAIMAVAASIAVSALLYGYISTPAPSSIPYGQFLADVGAGRVSQVVQTGTTLEVTGPHGAYRVIVPTVLTDVYADVDHAAAAGHATLPEFSAQAAPDNSWIGIVLTALLPFAGVLVALVLALLLVVRPGQRERARRLTDRLRELDEAHRAGLVTDHEWQRQRARILDQA
jgi:hypothetical protein